MTQAGNFSIKQKSEMPKIDGRTPDVAFVRARATIARSRVETRRTEIFFDTSPAPTAT